MDQTQPTINTPATDDVATAPALGLGINPTASNAVAPSVPVSDSTDSVTSNVIVPDDLTSDTHGPVSPSDNGLSVSSMTSDDTAAPSVTMAPTVPPSGSSDLEGIKKQALEQLSPLVSKLDQAPEERYKTLMMLIQASDNDSLISEAYDAAQKISDEKVRAEALLNIVNEINYFAQKNASN